MKDGARKNVILKDLGDGLVLRHPTIEDTDALATLNAQAFEGSSASFEIYTREAMSGEDPRFRLDDITVVEETLTGALVSTVSLSSHTFSYGGLLFAAGRVAWAVTRPDYRRRGLVRKQFEVIHERSSQRGHKLQLVGGIDMYLKFGYYPARWECRKRSWKETEVPQLRDNESELYSVRPATGAEVRFMAELCKHATNHRRVANVRDEAIWLYEVLKRNKDSYAHMDCAIIESVKGEPIGYLTYSREWLDVEEYELKPNVSWQAVTPSVLRYLFQTCKEQERQEAFFYFEASHPFWETVEGQIDYVEGCYLRIPNLPDFLCHIAPVLERRLAESALAEHTGILKINLFQDGLRLRFENGHLTEVQSWSPTPADEGDAAFEKGTFKQLVLGCWTFEELSSASFDYWADEEARELLQVLFPKQPSYPS